MNCICKIKIEEHEIDKFEGEKNFPMRSGGATSFVSRALRGGGWRATGEGVYEGCWGVEPRFPPVATPDCGAVLGKGGSMDDH